MQTANMVLNGENVPIFQCDSSTKACLLSTSQREISSDMEEGQIVFDCQPNIVDQQVEVEPNVVFNQSTNVVVGGTDNVNGCNCKTGDHILDPEQAQPLHEHLKHAKILHKNTNVSLHSVLHPDNQVIIDMTLKSTAELWHSVTTYSVQKHTNPRLSATFIMSKHQRQQVCHLLDAFENKTKEFPILPGSNIEIWYNKPGSEILCGVINISPRMFILKAKYGNQIVKILFDSGATHSFVNQNSVNLQQLNVKHTGDIPTVTVANNQQVPIAGIVCDDLVMGKCVIKQLPLHVMPLMEGIDILLGGDFLTQFGVQLDYNTHSLTIRNHNRHYLFNEATFDNMMLAQIEAENKTQLPLKSKRQLRKYLSNGGKFILAMVKTVEPQAQTSANINPQQARVDKQYVSGEQVINSTEAIKSLPSKLQEVLRKHSKVFEALEPGLQGKIHISEQVIPTYEHSPPFRPIYRLTPAERAEMERQIAIFLANGWIRPSTSPYGAPVLFAQKQDGSMRMCVDYREVNKITIKNRYPLPNIQDLFDMLHGAKYFSSLDLLTGYHQIALNESDIPKTAFRTPMGHFEVLVLWEGLCNAPSIFQSVMYRILQPYIGKFVALYIDDILIFSKNAEEHARHVDLVLGLLEKNNLKAKLSKCKFAQTECKFLGHILNGEGIRMDPKKAQAVQDWPVPKSTKDLQRFLGLSNYFRKFIPNYSLIAADLTHIQSDKNIWTQASWGASQQHAFDALKQALADAAMLWHPDLNKPFELHVDASCKGVGAVLVQNQAEEGAQKALRPIAYFSKQFVEAEKKLLPADQEFYGLVFALEHFREYLEGVKFTVKTDNSPLTAILTNPKLNRRKANAVDKLARYDFTIEHMSGVTNTAADCLSRNPLWTDPVQTMLPFANVTTRFKGKTGDDIPQSDVNMQRTQWVQDKLAQKAVTLPENESVLPMPVAPADEDDGEFMHPLISEILAGYAFDKWFADPINTSSLTKSDVGLWLKKDNTAKLLQYRKPHYNYRIVVPNVNNLRHRIMQNAHDSPAAGHRAAGGMQQNIRRDFWWPNWSTDIERYCKTCPVCQRTKYRTTVPYGLLKPLQVPDRKWGSVSMDFVTNLPVTKHKNDTIMVVVDRLTKMVHLIPMQLTTSAPQVAQLLNTHVFKLHGLPDSVVSDRDPRFVSHFMTELWKLWGVQQCLSTAYRPQTDGQSERMNRTLQEYLRAYVTSSGKDWEEKLACAEFAMNDSYHASIGCTPFFLNYGCHPRSPLTVKLTKTKTPAAYDFSKSMSYNVQLAKKLLRRAQDRMKSQYDKHHQNLWYAKGEQVLLSTENLKLTGCSKFWPRYIGPFTISEVLDSHNYRLNLPVMWSSKIHDVFHIAVLKPYFSNGSFQPMVVPELLEEDSFQVEAIVDHRQSKKGKRTIMQYLCKYTDASPENNTWENEKEVQKAFPMLLRAYKLKRGLLANTS